MATWIVTGANRGIGLELCRQLIARREDVIAACRTRSEDLAALGATIATGVDITTTAAHEPILAALAGRKIDVLVHNAGILVPDALESFDPESIRRQFEVNALGPLRLTRALLGKLGKGSKVGLVSSRAGSIADNKSGGLYGYRMSKAALNMAATSLARDLASRGIAVVVLHPGYIKTAMTGFSGNDEPPVAAKGLLKHLDELTVETSARFLHANGEELPW